MLIILALQGFVFNTVFQLSTPTVIIHVMCFIAECVLVICRHLAVVLLIGFWEAVLQKLCSGMMYVLCSIL